MLLSADGHVLLTDFGLSKVALEATTVCGTPEFTAPEILSNATYDRTVDYWSLGIMTYDMLTGSPPFTGHNRKKIMESILKKKPVFPRFMTSFAREFCTKVIMSVCHFDARAHTRFFCAQLLKKNPAQRLGSTGVSAIKEHSFFRKMDFKKLLAREIPPPFIPTLVRFSYRFCVRCCVD